PALHGELTVIDSNLSPDAAFEAGNLAQQLKRHFGDFPAVLELQKLKKRLETGEAALKIRREKIGTVDPEIFGDLVIHRIRTLFLKGFSKYLEMYLMREFHLPGTQLDLTAIKARIKNWLEYIDDHVLPQNGYI